jgi:hypothetical protein
VQGEVENGALGRGEAREREREACERAASLTGKASALAPGRASRRRSRGRRVGTLRGTRGVRSPNTTHDLGEKSSGSWGTRAGVSKNRIAKIVRLVGPHRDEDA